MCLEACELVAARSSAGPSMACVGVPKEMKVCSWRPMGSAMLFSLDFGKGVPQKRALHWEGSCSYVVYDFL